jgi:Ca2+-binding EF-hand superfamily protein
VAIGVYKNYLHNKDYIEEKFAKYDTDHSGMLEADQLKVFLKGSGFRVWV